jgi:hypothetical protein
MDVNKNILEGMILENAFNEILNESLDNKKFKLSDLGRNGKDAAMFCTKICYNILLSKKEYEIIKPFVSGSVDKIFLDNKGKCKGYKILFTKCNGAESDEIKKTIKRYINECEKTITNGFDKIVPVYTIERNDNWYILIRDLDELLKFPSNKTQNKIHAYGM